MPNPDKVLRSREPSACSLPELVRIRQNFPSRAIPDLGGHIEAELARKGMGTHLPPGARVAVAVGSRGVASLPVIVRATVRHFRSAGLKPFVVPAMGSHGGGTGEGQRAVLAHLGITEEEAGCPIVSSVETVVGGTTQDGIETYLDRSAFESDGIFLINRVKWHTSFEAEIESGLLKIASVGLGKVRGATNYHQAAVRKGLGEVVRSVGRHILSTGKVIGGLGVVEDAHHAISEVAVERAADIEAAEIGLLNLARSWMARLPFDEIDLLIVDELGKQFSGTGMDSKIVNRHPYGGANLWPWAPRIFKIYVRNLSPQSYGNAIGIGMADMISERLHGNIDWDATLVNARAASTLTTIRAPYRARNDRHALELLQTTVGRSCPSDITIAWIRNTLELSELAVSQNLFEQAPESKGIETLGPAFPMRFDEAENLVSYVA